MLSTIISQKYATTILQNYLREGHVTGSFLLVGPPHVGKATAALQFAKVIQCDHPQPGPDSCDVCSACLAVDTRRHPDVRSVAPTGPSQILRIPQIWPRDGVKDFPPENALLHNLSYAPVRGKRRVFIIEDADAFNEETGNSLLKALEEPPPYATFVLTAPSVSAVLPTIFSRCHTVRFQSVPASEIETALVERGSDTSTARFLAAYSQGQVGTAIELASDEEMRTARETVILIAQQLSSTRTPIHALKLADELRKAGTKLAGSPKKDTGGDEPLGSRQSSVAVLEMLAFWYHDLLAITASGSDGAQSLVNADHTETLTRIAAHYDVPTLMKAIELVLALRGCVERNANAQIAFEALALRLIGLRAHSVR